MSSWDEENKKNGQNCCRKALAYKTEDLDIYRLETCKLNLTNIHYYGHETWGSVKRVLPSDYSFTSVVCISSGR